MNLELLKHRAFARAGLVGNPSDGYGGRTISLVVRNFAARVVLHEWEHVEIVLSQEDRCRFGSLQELAGDVATHGYYGGIRLIKATIKRFYDYCRREKLPLHDRRFSIRYASDIPRQVGLAGSSAIIVATLRALLDFFQVTMPREVQPSFVLSVESEELGITAGLQDRVIQVYEGLVYMDFAEEQRREVQGFAAYEYEPLDPSLLPRLYIAYSERDAEPTERPHANLRARFNGGESEVVAAMQRFADLGAYARDALLNRDHPLLSQLINENYDLRKSICPILPAHDQMVQTARRCGASAKFAGSGGAIIGVYEDDAMYAALTDELGKLGCLVLKPLV